jgi:GH15 family glucan-1,4-alpha-glucosidase
MSEIAAIRERLTLQTPVGGVARYERDYYHRVEHVDLKRVPGNPWVICTLWLAMHDIAVAKSISELEPALKYLQWAVDRALPSGVLAEQFHPHTGAPISVSPLTWSHATVITVVMHYLLKHAELTGKPSGVVAELVNPALREEE